MYLGALDQVNWSHALLRLLLQQELQGGAGSLTASWVRHTIKKCVLLAYEKNVLLFKISPKAASELCHHFPFLEIILLNVQHIL